VLRIEPFSAEDEKHVVGGNSMLVFICFGSTLTVELVTPAFQILCPVS
jgi:hypothetical protein